MRGFSILALLTVGLVLATAAAYEDLDDFGNSSNTSTSAPPTHTTSHAPATTHNGTTTNGTVPSTTHSLVTTQHGNSNVTTPVTPPVTKAPPPVTKAPPPVTKAPPPSDKFIMYKLSDRYNEKQVCFRMNTSITVMIGNNTTRSGRDSILSNRTFNGTISGDSFCSLNESKAKIFLEDDNIPGVVLGIILNATNTNKKQTWNIATLQFQVNDSDLQTVKDNTIRTFQVDGKTTFPYSQSIGFERLFQCRYSFYVNFTNLTNGSYSQNMYPSYFFKDVKLQAFQFKNRTSGDFGNNGVNCQAEASKGNKIVPIAVGAALAGLVVIVLIAYIIGRLRSRRHSYESLS